MTVELLHGDCRKVMADMWPGSAQAVICSPPYPGVRLYGDDEEQEIGRGTMADWLVEMGQVLDGCANALDDEGTAWFVLGDRAAGSGGAGGDFAKGGSKGWVGSPKGKFLPGAGFEYIQDGQWCLAPERFAMLAQERGWRVRSLIVWDQLQHAVHRLGHVRRPLECAEKIVLLARPGKYRWNVEAHQALPYPERGDVWHIRSQRARGAERHFAPYPPSLARRMIELATFPGDTVLDPFVGSGTTATCADTLGRNAIGIDLYQRPAVSA